MPVDHSPKKKKKNQRNMSSNENQNQDSQGATGAESFEFQQHIQTPSFNFGHISQNQSEMERQINALTEQLNVLITVGGTTKHKSSELTGRSSTKYTLRNC